MSLVKYEILNTVADVQSFTKAAAQLGLTQSAVSHAISSLEKEFGFNLIHRSRTGVKLTEDGYTMLLEMRKVLAAEELLQQEAAKVLGVAKGTVRIGIISTISANWMPDIIHLMDQHYPGIHIELREGDYYEIGQWIMNGEVDIGFLNRSSSKLFDFIPLKRDNMLCIVSSSSPLYDKEVIDLQDIVHEPFILSTYKGTNDVEMAFAEHQIYPSIRFQLYDEQGILSMVSHHLGISILPQLAIKKLPENVRAMPFKQEVFRMIGVASKQKLSPAANKFVELLKQWLQTNE